MTPPGTLTFRYETVIAAAAAVFVALAGSTLRAPGPAGLFLEPRTGMPFVAIEPGTFTMGSPAGEAGRGEDETPRQVTLTRRIFIGVHEVTETEWAVIMGDDPEQVTDCGLCPVVHVDFFEVSDFLTQLNARSTAMRFRLPTEAEWEYACRAGTATPFSTGARIEADEANYDARYPYPGGQAGTPRGRKVPVGSFPANAWGLRDMHGNAWEWTGDWYGPYPPGPATDPAGPAAGTKRVIRGGSFHFDANSARCGLRYTHAPQDKGFSLGFRVVAEPIE